MAKKIGVYICHCGTNISATVDCQELVQFFAALPGVKVARDYRYLCSDPGQDLIKRDIRELDIDRVVIAACSPRMHETTFRNALGFLADVFICSCSLALTGVRVGSTRRLRS